MTEENAAQVGDELAPMERLHIDHEAEREEHGRQRAELAKERERVHWIVHDKATRRVLRRGYCARHSVSLQMLHSGEGIIELEPEMHHVTANSHEVDSEGGALIPRRRVLRDDIAQKRRSLALAFDVAVQADFNAMAHSDDADPHGEFRKKRLLHRDRLNSLNILLDRATSTADVEAIFW